MAAVETNMVTLRTALGQPHVLLPGGRVQTVEYAVDGYAGYKAAVHYKGATQEFRYDAIKKEYEPVKPVKPVHGPVKAVYQPLKPVYQPVNSVFATVKPVYNTVSPIKKQSTTNFSQCHF